jgi:SAM-dependent methyltransferase
MDRTEKALCCIDVDGRGLELGPSYSPLVTKASGHSVETLDHATREELVSKYRELGVESAKIDQIEDVDYIWEGGSLLNVVPSPGVYDYVIASHFIEHTVDLVGFLQDCERLLNDKGRLSLVIPDKRFCFDRFKPHTSLGEVIDAHVNARRFHPPSAHINEAAYATTRDGVVAWARGDLRDLAMRYDGLTDVPVWQSAAEAQSEYIDVHRWIFTPTSFELIIDDLADLGYHNLGVVSKFETDGFEFFATLGPKNAAPTTKPDRLARLEAIESELAFAEHDTMAELRNATLAENQALRREAAILTAELDALRSSASWRLTAPVRAVWSKLRR